MKKPNWIQHGLTRVPDVILDAGLAGALFLLGAVQLASNHRPFDEGHGHAGPAQPGFGPPPLPHQPDVWTYLLLGGSAGLLILRRRHPLIVLGGVTALAAIYLGRGESPFTIQLIYLVAMYSAVADSSLPRFAAILVALGAAAVLGLAIALGGTPRSDSAWAMDAAWAIAAILLADSVRSRRAYTLELERTREEEALRRVSEERLGIARELHDVVGHNIALINVQAGAGAYVLYQEPAQAQEAFENIRTASHETLEELRSIVGVLRDPASAQPLRPVAGLDALEQLVKSTRDAGQEVELVVEGKRRPLPSVVDLSAYRVLQEALTNTVRHAPQGRVRVLVAYDDDKVSLEVTNGGGAEGVERQPGGGQGLPGMRERVLAIGGELSAGPEPDGGFHLKAVLPLAEPAA